MISSHLGITEKMFVCVSVCSDKTHGQILMSFEIVSWAQNLGSVYYLAKSQKLFQNGGC